MCVNRIFLAIAPPIGAVIGKKDNISRKYSITAEIIKEYNC